jgi:murein DD-endopeptidase MepM/ murein hydrolase activator NlpD
MQIFWVSGPVGRIHSFNLSAKTVVFGFAVLAVLLVGIGSALQFFGFRLALEYDPQIARQLGNLHTAVELENLNAVYHGRLKEIETEQRVLLEKVKGFEAANAKLVETLTPAVVVRSRPQPRAQGGAYVPQTHRSVHMNGSVLDALHDFGKSTRSQNRSLADRLNAWQSDIAWLEGLPISLPVAPANASISSGFGERSDPFSRRRAMHTGLDFELPLQTTVVAAGAGTVIEAGWDSQYGHVVVIRHRDGYTSRYAHNSALLVHEGMMVTKGQTIARSGNSGRSTGPHLHFEVLKNGQPIDPAQVLVVLNR